MTTLSSSIFNIINHFFYSTILYYVIISLTQKSVTFPEIGCENFSNTYKYSHYFDSINTFKPLTLFRFHSLYLPFLFSFKERRFINYFDSINTFKPLTLFRFHSLYLPFLFSFKERRIININYTFFVVQINILSFMNIQIQILFYNILIIWLYIYILTIKPYVCQFIFSS